MLMCVYEIVIFRKHMQSFSGLNISPHALPMLFECCYKSSVLVTVTFHCLTMPRFIHSASRVQHVSRLLPF